MIHIPLVDSSSQKLNLELSKYNFPNLIIQLCKKDINLEVRFMETWNMYAQILDSFINEKNE